MFAGWLLAMQQTGLERLARDKHSSLLQKVATYGRKKFYNNLSLTLKTVSSFFMDSTKLGPSFQL
jgi:hypothetical protein